MPDEKAADDVREMIRAVVEEFVRADPARQAELVEERKRRESLEQRVNELVAENQRSRAAAEEAERSAAIRAELQRLGVAKVELAYKAVKDDVYRARMGGFWRRGARRCRSIWSSSWERIRSCCRRGWREGRGRARGTERVANETGGGGLDKIRPGMGAEELERVRQEDRAGGGANAARGVRLRVEINIK